MKAKYGILFGTLCIIVLMFVPLFDSTTVALPEFETVNAKGQVVNQQLFDQGGVLLFFRSTCPYCTLNIPYWRQIKAEFPNVPIIVVLHKQSLEGVAPYLNERKPPFDEVLFDRDWVIWNTLGATYTPMCWVFDKEGQSIGHFGTLNDQNFKSLRRVVSKLSRS